MKRIKTVLFDLGNVLVRVDPDAFWRNLGLDGLEERGCYLTEYMFLTGQYESGQVKTEDFLIRLSGILNNKFSIDRLEQAFSAVIGNPVDEMAGIVRQTAEIYDTALASNTSEIHYDASLKKCAFLRYLSRQYLSCRLRLMKPSAAFYRAIIKDQGLIPSELLFIDDNAENVAAAEDCGLQAVHFINVERLECVLQAFRVL